jgi:hypothetical protein
MAVAEPGIHLDGITHEPGYVCMHKYREHRPQCHHYHRQPAAAFVAQQSFNKKSYHCSFPLKASVGFIFAIFRDGR